MLEAAIWIAHGAGGSDVCVDAHAHKRGMKVLAVVLSCFPRTEANSLRATRIRQVDYYMKEIGAGEGIRTLDPDLGKVVLYP